MHSEHFSERELACHHGINLCKQELVDALEQLRAIVGKPIHVNDAYRCGVCNQKLPNSAKNSQHRLGLAADIQVEGMTAAELYRAALEVPAFRGIGVSRKSYIHVDVRQTFARWCYDASGKECAWDHSLDA